jgi:hypothetical protein
VSVGFDGQSAGAPQLIAQVFPSKLLANQFFGATTLGAVTNDVAAVLGREAISFDRWAQQNAAAFR